MYTEADIQNFIDNKVEENLNLDYKACDSISGTDGKKKEIAKDVSAMANSDGGLIIYGLKQFGEDALKHRAEKIDPIDRLQYSKEWLESVINSNIRPRISGVQIHSVQLSSSDNHVAYIVEIPQSQTAHQANDFRYYKRYNFESVPMHDYEIRDILGRQIHPKILVEAEVSLYTGYEDIPNSNRYDLLAPPKQRSVDAYELVIFASNVGRRYANYVTGILHVPSVLIESDSRNNSDITVIDGVSYVEIICDNTTRDVVDHYTPAFLHSRPIPKYGPSRYEPILPGLRSRFHRIQLVKNFVSLDKSNLKILYEVFADNSEPNRSALDVGSLKFNDIREHKSL